MSELPTHDHGLLVERDQLRDRLKHAEAGKRHAMERAEKAEKELRQARHAFGATRPRRQELRDLRVDAARLRADLADARERENRLREECELAALVLNVQDDFSGACASFPGDWRMERYAILRGDREAADSGGGDSDDS